MTFTPTEEQNAVVLAAQNTSDNLIIQALAGAAKTSTLELIARALPDVSMLYLAFNKRNAVEAQERLPSNCKAMTLNALGHRTWSEATGRRIIINASKTYELLLTEVNKLPSTERRSIDNRFSDLLRLVDFGKQCGYVPTGLFDRAKRLFDDDEFFNHIEQRLTEVEIDLIRKVTYEGINEAMQGRCDYNDQIFMPTIFHGAFPRYPLILVDEAQDLSALNHATLRKMAKKRLICVGDSRQAIYGFRGAHEDSMDSLAKEFSMKEFTLSISFRCPTSIIAHAQWRAPHMKAPAWAKEGEVTHLDSWNATALPESAAIICRNNAPLFSIAIKLLKAGRHSQIGNADIAKNLIKIMKKFGGNQLSSSDLFDEIDSWEDKEKEKNKPRAHGGIADRAECMRIFAAQGSTLGEAIAYAEHLCASTGPLKLMTGHKAKGLEFDHVFFLDQHLIGPDEQDPNLRYVIQTRSKDTLTYVNSDDFIGE